MRIFAALALAAAAAAQGPSLTYYADAGCGGAYSTLGLSHSGFCHRAGDGKFFRVVCDDAARGTLTYATDSSCDSVTDAIPFTSDACIPLADGFGSGSFAPSCAAVVSDVPTPGRCIVVSEIMGARPHDGHRRRAQRY